VLPVALPAQDAWAAQSPYGSWVPLGAAAPLSTAPNWAVHSPEPQANFRVTLLHYCPAADLRSAKQGARSPALWVDD